MTLIESVKGKMYAARTLGRMVRWFRNWREVWQEYRQSRPLPPIHFRDGFVLHHGPWDNPLELIYDVYASGDYRRHMPARLSGVMIDIGANIGLTTMMFAAQSPDLRIYAYEPNPSTNEVLRRNVQASGFDQRVTVYDEAVGSCGGTTRLWTQVSSVYATGYKLMLDAPGAACQTVPMVDLNDSIARTGAESISFLKIDTEGAEADILEGASPDTLAAVERLALEYHDCMCPNALVRCQSVLDKAGFETRSYPAQDKPGLGMLYAWRD